MLLPAILFERMNAGWYGSLANFRGVDVGPGVDGRVLRVMHVDSICM